jgi:hypothetical protein
MQFKNSLVVLVAAVLIGGGIAFGGLTLQNSAHCDQLNQQYLKVPNTQNKAEYEHACGTPATAATADAALTQTVAANFETRCRSHERSYRDDLHLGTPDPQAATQEQVGYAQDGCGRLPGFPSALGS